MQNNSQEYKAAEVPTDETCSFLLLVIGLVIDLFEKSYSKFENCQSNCVRRLQNWTYAA